MSNGFGKAKYDNNSGYEIFKLVEGDNIYRILPPIKSLVQSRQWHKFIGIHYGYFGVNPKNPDKPFARPFGCIRDVDFKSGAVKMSCPECDSIAAKKESLEAAQIELAEAVKKKEDTTVLEAKIEALKAWLYAHNCDNKQYLNVKNQEGKFGPLKMPNSALKALKVKIDAVREKQKLDPLDVDKGVWFNLVRVGMDKNSQYSPEVVTEEVERDGETFQRIKYDTLTEDERSEALATCPDLTEIARVLTKDQIRALVNSSGDPAEVDAILGVSQPRARGEQSARSFSREELAPLVVKAAPTAFKAPGWDVNPEEVKAPVVKAESLQDDEETALLAKLAEARAKKAAQATQVAPVAAATPVASGTNTMSHDDFVAKFGKK